MSTLVCVWSERSADACRSATMFNRSLYPGSNASAVISGRYRILVRTLEEVGYPLLAEDFLRALWLAATPPREGTCPSADLAFVEACWRKGHRTESRGVVCRNAIVTKTASAPLPISMVRPPFRHYPSLDCSRPTARSQIATTPIHQPLTVSAIASDGTRYCCIATLTVPRPAHQALHYPAPRLTHLSSSAPASGLLH